MGQPSRKTCGGPLRQGGGADIGAFRELTRKLVGNFGAEDPEKAPEKEVFWTLLEKKKIVLLKGGHCMN